jgi:hypothetical protein
MPSERIASCIAIPVVYCGEEALYERRSQDGERREKGSSDFFMDGKIVSGSNPQYSAGERQGSVRE